MNSQSMLQQVQALAASGKTADAIALCEKYCHEHQTDASAWLICGTLRGQTGDLHSAESCFRRAMNLAPDNLQIKLNLAKALFNQNKVGDASEILEQVMHNDPYNREALQMRGNIAANQGSFDLALKCFESLLKLDPNNIPLIHHVALLHKSAGSIPRAIEYLKRAIALSPSRASALNDMGALYQAEGNDNEAIDHYRKAVTIEPRNPIFLYNLGNLYRKQERLEEAIDAFKVATEAKKDFPEAHNALGLCYLGIFSFENARRAFTNAAEDRPDFLEAQFNLANTLLRLGELDAAEERYSRCLTLNPGTIQAKVGLAITLERKRLYQSAYEQIADIALDSTEGILAAPVYGTVCRRLDLHDQAIATLETAVEKSHSSDTLLRAQTHFALGDLYDDIGRYDQAIEHYHKANSLLPQSHSVAANKSGFETIISTFSHDNLHRLPRAAKSRRRYVFVVGMPRSGTSLIQKILDSHASVFGAGELPHIAHIAGSVQRNTGSKLAYPECVTEVTQALIQQFSEYYEQKIDELHTDATYIVDKMPHNFTDLGLICMLFPNARVIHCTRDPLDTCLSIYFHEFNTNHPYSTDLASLGHYYRDYRRLMDHWKRVLPIEILDVKYEHLIDDPGTIIRRLIDDLDLPWDPNCLSFHENKRYMNTPSYDQVSRPIYTSSCQRWKNYEKHIQALREIIDDPFLM